MSHQNSNEDNKDQQVTCHDGLIISASGVVVS